MKTFIDLFCGIGGFRVALEKRGLKCVFSSDIDKHACEVYEQNFGERPYGDIKKVHAKDIPKHDILCAGFPCQAFSECGHRLGFEDTRGQLFYEIIRIAKFCNTKILFLENVKHIFRMRGGTVFEKILAELDGAGYDTHHSILNASHYGIPQSRVRVYLVCIRKDLKDKIIYMEPEPTYEKIYLKDILEPDHEVDPRLWCQFHDFKFKDGVDTSEKLGLIYLGHRRGRSSGNRLYHVHGHSPTVLKIHAGWYYGKYGVRRPSMVERKRIMGFPDNHIVSKWMHGFSQLGNAIIPKMVGVVYDGITFKKSP